MRNRKFINTLLQKIATVFIVGCSIVMLVNLGGNNQNKTLENQIKVEKQIQQVRDDIDIQKIIYRDRVSKAQNFISSISTKSELIVYETSGVMKHHIDKTPNREGAFDLRNSEIDVSMNYNLIMSIPMSKIDFNVDRNGLVNVTYRQDDIKVKSIDTQVIMSENKRLFGKEFNNEEKLAITELLKDKLRDEYNNSQEVKVECEASLNSAISDIAVKCGTHSIQFNSGVITNLRYVYTDCSNVKYGHDNRKLNDIKYVVIHSTANKNSDAMGHVEWLNNNSKSNATHFYVDDENVVKALGLDMRSWSVGNGGNGITNSNSINVEMCEFEDKDKQEKTIENTIDFVKRVLVPALKEQGYDVKVVRHYDATEKNCPRILNDGVGIEWKDFIRKIVEE